MAVEDTGRGTPVYQNRRHLASRYTTVQITRMGCTTQSRCGGPGADCMACSPLFPMLLHGVGGGLMPNNVHAARDEHGSGDGIPCPVRVFLGVLKQGGDQLSSPPAVLALEPGP